MLVSLNCPIQATGWVVEGSCMDKPNEKTTAKFSGRKKNPQESFSVADHSPNLFSLGGGFGCDQEGGAPAA